MTPKFTTKNDIPIVDGHFEFTVNKPLILNKFGTPVFNISFEWSPELDSEISLKYSDKDLIPIMAERLKDDFINFLNTYQYEQNFQ